LRFSIEARRVHVSIALRAESTLVEGGSYCLMCRKEENALTETNALRMLGAAACSAVTEYCLGAKR
jgi:hypothetical protein